MGLVTGQVRDYEFDQELQQTGATDGVKTAADAKRSQLEQWSATAYGEVSITGMHTMPWKHQRSAHTKYLWPRVEFSSAGATQAFSAWIHICAIRLFVESILRYGLPPQFLAVLLKPNHKAAAKLRKLLGSVFGSSGAALTLP